MYTDVSLVTSVLLVLQFLNNTSLNGSKKSILQSSERGKDSPKVEKLREGFGRSHNGSVGATRNLSISRDLAKGPWIEFRGSMNLERINVYLNIH